MSSIDLSIKSLEKEERARSKNHLNEIEDKWENVLSETTEENYVEAFKRYNRFRLRNLLVLKKKRPGLLLGYINDHQFPNFHTFELLKVADIVSLTSSREDQANEVDRVYYFPSSDDFCDSKEVTQRISPIPLPRYASRTRPHASSWTFSYAISNCSRNLSSPARTSS